jgi:hypothetical protein
MRRLLAAAVLALWLGAAWADDAHLYRPDGNPAPKVIVPVQKVPGNYIGCVIVPTSSTRTLTGLGRVHAVACVEATTGEVIVAVLRKNGTLYCSGKGYVDPANTSCAIVNVCGVSDYYCLF